MTAVSLRDRDELEPLGEPSDGDPPFLGRDLDLREVESALASDGAAVFVTTDYGAGKTRFLQEAARRLPWSVEAYRCRHRREADLRRGRWSLATLADDVDAGTELLILDDVHYAEEYQVELLMEGLWGWGIKALMAATPDYVSYPGRLRRFPIVALSALDDQAVLQLAGLPASSPYADPVLALVKGHPFGAILAGQAIRQKSRLATILGPDGRPLDPDSAGFQAVELAVKGISDELIARLVEQPELMYDLDWRKFEELVAELYDRDGYEVALTRGSKDGGVDIYALHRAPHAKFLTVIDTKRNHAGNPVGVELVKQLRSTVADANAHMGVITTTSYFTKGAKDYRESHEHQLGLQDFASVHDMLKRAHDT